MIEKIFDIGECEKTTTLDGKLTVVINTYNENVERIACCILSLLQNSRSVNGFLEHIIVCIHGPDIRTGDTESQDIKQSFLEDLRLLKWKPLGSDEERDMPLTIIRVWSRIGIGQSLDMAMPWIHTEFFVVISEKFIFLNDSWIEKLQCIKEFDFLYFKETDDRSDNNQYFCSKYDSDFFASSKKIFEKKGLRWTDHSVFGDFIVQDKSFGNLVAECGSWIKESLFEFKGKKIKLDFVEKTYDYLFEYLIKDFLNDLKQNQEYNDLYLKYTRLNETKLNMVEKYKTKNFDKDLKFLVCVCVYDRFRPIANWLRAWKNANKYGTKLAVIHSWGLLNSNNEFKEKPNEDQKNIILKYEPDYYIPRKNNGMDVGAFKDMLNNKDVGEWDVLIWFTDDCIPMNKDFLLPFLVEMSNPEVGIVEAFPELSYCRTVSFAIKKEAMMKIPWINDGNIVSREDCLRMENLLSGQVEQVGYKRKSPCPIHLHWSKLNKYWLWDIHESEKIYGKKIDQCWTIFENQFEEKDRIENSLEHLESFKARYRS